jgi:hypothetical protein
MTSNDNTAAQMLLFPTYERDKNNFLSDHEAILQCRLSCVRLINSIRSGALTFPDSEIQRIKGNVWTLNDYLSKYGYELVNDDF